VGDGGSHEEILSSPFSLVRRWGRKNIYGRGNARLVEFN